LRLRDLEYLNKTLLLDIVDVVSETVQLRRSGKNYLGFCPFHSNTRTPAFVVFPETGTWRCFGQCNEGGDIFGFVMKREGWDFSEALRVLANKAGVQLRPPTPREQAAADQHERYRELLENAATFFRHHLKNTPEGQKALEYLHQRGLGDDVLEAFGLGYAPGSWDSLTNFFLDKGNTQEELVAVGLVTERDSGGVYDRFRHRVVFPIRDARGRMTGFGGRILNPEDVPKFINSPQTVLFDKSNLLYGLDRARKAIRTQDQAVIVEGYLDVIALHQAGYESTVSPMGIALSERQLRLIKRYTRRIVLALDADAAGDRATMRGLQTARQALDRETEPVFDARGLISHEGRLKADIRVTTLPPDMDPDDVVNQDPAQWGQILENANPIVIHVMETLANKQDIDDPKIKSQIAQQVLPLIGDVPDSLERETYRQRLARLLKVDERVLSESAGTAPARSRRRRTRKMEEVAPTLTTHGRGYRILLEAHCLGMLMRHPEMVYQVDRMLQEERLARLSKTDFDQAEYQTIFRLIQESLEQDVSEPLNYVLNNLSLELIEEADDLVGRTENVDTYDRRVLEDLFRTILELRHRKIHQNIDHLRFLMEEAQEEGDLKSGDLQKSIVQYTLILNRLDHARGRYTSRAITSR
jgi:DNA primase